MNQVSVRWGQQLNRVQDSLSIAAKFGYDAKKAREIKPTAAQATIPMAYHNSLGLRYSKFNPITDILGFPRSPVGMSRPFAAAAKQSIPQVSTSVKQISVKLAQAKTVLAAGDTKAAAGLTWAALQIYKTAGTAMLPSESIQVLKNLNQMTTHIETVKTRQALARLPAVPTHRPGGHPGSGGGGSLSDLEADRRACEIIQQVEKAGAGTLDIAGDMAELMNELTSDPNLIATSKQVNSISSRPFMQDSMRNPSDVLAEINDMTNDSGLG